MKTYTFEFEKALEEKTFEPRTDINEFLRDGKVVSDIYDVTLKLLYRKSGTPDDALKIFNCAYRICWMATVKKMSYGQITSELYFNRDNYLVRDLSYAVAWALLTLHAGLLDIDRDTLDAIRIGMRKGVASIAEYREVIRKAGDFTEPIDFASPRSMFWQAVKKNLDEEVTTIQIKSKTPFEQIKEGVSGILDKAKELETSKNAMECRLRKQEENHQNELKSRDMQISMLQSEVAQHVATIADKDREIENLRLRLRHTTHIQIVEKEVIKEVPVGNADPINEVINHKSILNYGMGMSNPVKINLIASMLTTIAFRSGFNSADLLKEVKQLEDLAAQMERPAPTLVTNKITGDYVETQNNHHHKSETHE